ncbi:hypothetical protein F4861DRAFT_479739 [Xylaria intraflava]|nr:hypothetical protein F4861DRAFT_479739 [Xylaria intraflava]
MKFLVVAAALAIGAFAATTPTSTSLAPLNNAAAAPSLAPLNNAVVSPVSDHGFPPPPPPHRQCSAPEYICKPNLSGWFVCDIEGNFISGGDCNDGTRCKEIGGLPFCI